MNRRHGAHRGSGPVHVAADGGRHDTDYLGRLGAPGADAVPASRLLGLGLLAVVLIAGWWRCATSTDQPVTAALQGAGFAFAATIALAPSFHPWYALAPLMLLAATTVRTDLIMTVAASAALLVLPDGGGLAGFVKLHGALLMTLLLIVLAIRYGRSFKPLHNGPFADRSSAPPVSFTEQRSPTR